MKDGVRDMKNVRLVMAIVGAIGLIALTVGLILFFTKGKEMIMIYSLAIPGGLLMLLSIAYETKLLASRRKAE